MASSDFAWSPRAHIHSSVSVPIQHEDRVLGVLSISSHNPQREFGPADRDWLHGVARDIGRVLPAGALPAAGGSVAERASGSSPPARGMAEFRDLQLGQLTSME
jgi:signal transduction protein with GAF and PtsI domain